MGLRQRPVRAFPFNFAFSTQSVSLCMSYRLLPFTFYLFMLQSACLAPMLRCKLSKILHVSQPACATCRATCRATSPLIILFNVTVFFDLNY